MKIAYFTDSYLPQVNGVTYAVQAYAEQLIQRHQVKIYAPAYGLMYETEKEKNLVVERYPSVPVIAYREVRLPLVDWRRLDKSLTKFDPDIIHIHSPGSLGLSGIRLAKKLKKPLVGTYHTLFSETIPPLPMFKFIPGGWLRKGIWNVSNRVFNQCDLVTAPTRVIVDELVSHGLKSRAMALSNGIETRKFSAKRNYGSSKKVLYVGRVSYEKNVDVVIRAFGLVFKQIPEAKLVIVGGGPAVVELEELAWESGVGEATEFTGYIAREKLGKYYREAGVLATASTMDTQSLVVLEAMACGLPVVGVEFAGLKETIEPGKNGYLVAPGDEAAMAKKMLEILNNPNLAEKLGKAARRSAEEQDIRRVVKELERVYTSLKTKDSAEEEAEKKKERSESGKKTD